MRDVEQPGGQEIQPIRQGTPIRDAAVDPMPGDYQPPTNAGTADPHGPDVVSIQATAAPPRSEGDDPWYFPKP